MYKLRYLNQARDDLLHIKSYLTRQSGSSAVALKFTSKLRQQCRKLASYSGQVGHPRPELGKDIRSFAYGNYLIFFMYKEQELRVISITEGHRDLLNLFR
ncbi:type II toxin-antitoxin system RelE/ParE family toxin [Porticoccus sp. W117]|uniref:type II toxin-antitoxin system RelE/ParE family toxin n=1 Tax=Porticoccus sp. W117 TaxID=3054777 RepID=UPI002591F4C3|nr:type II toxin-antitoxin system RelE/ParE family toxin [Porticoccus sp. W117]MDM3870977.1 type II toxin-antitoxin system RelE/ParE family toxin [Porticoccus sp. W117]